MPQAAWTFLGSPAWLAVAAALAVAIVALHLRGATQARGAWLRGLPRAGAVLLAVAALSGPAVPMPGADQAPWLVLQDVSGSVRGQSDDPLVLPAPATSFDFSSQVAPRGGALADAPTRLVPAARLAAARAGEVAGTVLHTDGQFFDDDLATAAAALASAGEVWIVPMLSPPVDARVTELRAWREGGQVHLRAGLTANARTDRTLVVRRTHPQATELLRRDVTLLGGESRSLRLTDDLGPDQTGEYLAELLPGDRLPENDAASAVVLPVRGSVAVVSAEPGQAQALAGRFAYPVEWVSPAAAPVDAGGWLGFAAVVVLDGAGELLDAPQRAALADSVGAGTGLVWMGAGPHASPGDAADAIHRALPLRVNPYERQPLRLVLVLDASGSMGELVVAAGRNVRQFDLAAEAALDLRRHLTPQDSLAIVTFAQQAEVIYDSRPGGPDFARVADALRGVLPAGPTDAAVGLEEALPLAGGDRPGLVLVLTDLDTQPFDVGRFEDAFRARGVELGIVATADAPAVDAPLVVLAQRLNATMVRQDDLRALGRVFARLLAQARPDPLIPGPHQAVLLPPASGAEQPVAREVAAYYAAAGADGAQVLGTVDGDAVLARRVVGLGRSVMLAVPPTQAGALGDVLAWSVAWSGRDASDGRFAGSVRRADGALYVEVLARDQAGPMDALSLEARWRQVHGGGEAWAVLEQVGPGRYAARLAEPEAPAVLVVRQDGRDVWVEGLGRTAGEEFRRIGPDWESLRQLAELAGGRIVSAEALAGRLRQERQDRHRPLWPVLVLSALALMLGDWAAGRRSGG